jgi:hypothetical protein
VTVAAVAVTGIASTAVTAVRVFDGRKPNLVLLTAGRNRLAVAYTHPPCAPSPAAAAVYGVC